MASNTHVDSRVAERRLRPIYDWLDSGNNKKALQEAEKVLKKQPNFLCAKVLKVLALQRLGREAECEEILEKVCQEVPTDEATLQAITICYRAVHKPRKICEVYSAASKKDPTNEELLTHLFMSYVRVGDYRKQHQHAMSLYKLRQKNPYYFWAVMSVVMQAKEDENIGKTVALKLAEKMVSKFVSEGKIEAEQEVHLYLMILEMQGKYEEALDVIEGELGEKLKSLVTTSVKRIELLMKLERWKEANVLIKCQLEKNPDSWLDYKNYLETTLKFYEEFQKFKDSDNGAKEHFDNRVPIPSDGGECIVWHEADYTPQMAQEYITQLIKKVESEKKKIRGPYLAQLELYRLLVSGSQDAQNTVGDLTDLLVNFFDKFAEKPICVSDLKPYLSLLSLDSVSLFMKRISDIVGLGDGESAKSISSLQKHISRLQFSRILGFHGLLSVEERLRFCDLLLDHYRSSQEFVSDDKLPTEYSCNDPYIVLLSHVLFSVYQDTNSSEHIIRAIYHLEEALSKSPSNFHFKILLVKFYLILGGGEQAFHFYEHLELKHIQLDSMGYLLGTSIYGLGNISHAVALYDMSLKFFISNTNDSVDHLTYAYKYGSFVKIEEFIEFRDRLNESLHYFFFNVEKMFHDVLSALDHTQTELLLKGVARLEKINWSTVRDNRDLRVVLSYEPSCKQLNEKTVAKSFENLKNYVKLRVLTIKCLAAVLSIVKDEQIGEKNNVNDECMQNGDTQCPKDVLVNLISELKNLYDELNSQDLDLNVQEVINAPSPCRLKTYLTVPIHQIISVMTSVILQSEENDSKDNNELTNAAQPVSETLKTVTTACINKINNNDLLKRKELLETIVSVVEMLSITAMLCGFFKTLIKRTRKNQKKGKRRKEEEGGRDLNLCKNLLKDVSECIRDLDGALNRVIEQHSTEDLSSEVNALNIENESNNSNNYSSIVKKLRESYNLSLQEIKQFLQDKQTYLNAL